MISAPIPENEDQRLRYLKDLNILDTLEEQAYDDLTHLAAQICATPIALVSLIDTDRQWFKSHYGLDARETPREVAYCSHAILSDELFIVEDSEHDERFHDNPLYTSAPNVKFYAGAPLILHDNIRVGTLCVIDNHARQLTDEQKESLNALARQVVRQLELRLKVRELEKLDEAKDEFISMVSHELRTPLTSINGSLAMINAKRNSFDEKISNMVSIAFRNSGRLIALVNDILDLSKLEAGNFEIQLQPYDIVDLVYQAADLNRNYCEQCNTNIVVSSVNAKQPVMVTLDDQRVMQVLSNLISNAAKFSADEGAIELSVEVGDDKVRVNVIDHGIGVSVDQQKELFQKFKQLGDCANNKKPGTGLGLNISKKIIELHQGEIGCESIPEKETTFYFVLPLTKKPLQTV